MAKIVDVKFLVAVNEDATDEEIREWIRFELCDRGDMSMDNKLCNEPMRPMHGSVEIRIESSFVRLRSNKEAE